MAASFSLDVSAAFISLLLTVSTFFMAATVSDAQLRADFYTRACPNLLPTVKSAVQSAIDKERRMGASILRLFFHDCFVNGCDGSVLLDDTASFQGEKGARPNKNSARGFEVIDDIKSKVEALCPATVSCADILAIAARDSTVLLGGPHWDVKLGRRDARTASQADANSKIPSPASSLSQLLSSFSSEGLSIRDLVALSGAHTIGQARCATFRGRIYNDSNINRQFAISRQRGCPATSPAGDNNLAPLDLTTATRFDNVYYSNLINRMGLLHSDQELFSGGSADAIVRGYMNNPRTFSSDFASAMIKMGDIAPSGSDGEIRKNCRRVN